MTRQTGPGRRAIYPWDRWFRAGSFVLVAGDHYSCATHGMMQMIRSRAAERGVRVSIKLSQMKYDQGKIDHDAIHVKVIDADPPNRDPRSVRRHAAKVRAVRR